MKDVTVTRLLVEVNMGRKGALLDRGWPAKRLGMLSFLKLFFFSWVEVHNFFFNGKINFFTLNKWEMLK